MSTLRSSNRYLEYLGIILIILLGGTFVIAVYQFGIWINKPLPTRAHEWSDRQVETQIQRFVFDHNSNFSPSRLLSIPERTRRTLLKILAENTATPRFASETRRGYRHETPLTRICELFPDGPVSAPAVKFLLPYLSISDETTKANIVQLLISTGHESTAAVVEIGLRSEDLRWKTLNTIRSLKQDGALSLKIEIHVWPILEELVTSDDHTEQTAQVMLKLDSQRATSFFTSPEILDFSKKRTERILSACSDGDTIFDRDLLLPMIGDMQEIPDNKRSIFAHHLLGILAISRHPDERELLVNLTEHDDGRIASRAARALLIWHDVPYGNIDFRDLPDVPPQIRIHMATQTLISRVGRSGLRRHFEFLDLSTEDQAAEWKLAIQGLNAIGAERSAEMFTAALDVFGGLETAADPFARQLVLDELYEPMYRKLVDLTREWDAGDDRPQTKLWLYVFKHKEVFQKFERLPRQAATTPVTIQLPYTFATDALKARVVIWAHSV
jgi:hypothetical protein